MISLDLWEGGGRGGLVTLMRLVRHVWQPLLGRPG